MHFIQPQDRHQTQLFSNLDELIAPDNYIRLIDLLVDKIVDASLDQFIHKGKKNIGRKAYHPAIMLKLYLYGYFNEIKSSRKLEKETHRNIELFWLMGQLKPDHKTISDYRKDNEDVIKYVTIEFRKFLKAKGYIQGETIVVDGSKIKANATNDGLIKLTEIEKRLENLNVNLDEYLEKLKQQDIFDNLKEEIENLSDDVNVEKHLLEEIVRLQSEIEDLDKHKRELEKQNRPHYFPTDPDCRSMRSKGGRKIPAYNAQIGVDPKHQMITLSEVTTDENDLHWLKKTAEIQQEQLDVETKEIIADKGYYNIGHIDELENDKSVNVFVPPTKHKRTKKDEEAGLKFTYDKNNDQYICSYGKKLKRIGKLQKKRHLSYFEYKGRDCGNCPIKDKCTTSKNGRCISRYINSDWLDNYKKKMNSLQAKGKMKQRKSQVEHVFGTFKQWMGKTPLLLRGKIKVQTEIYIYSTIYNLKRLMNIDNVEYLMTLANNYNWAKR